LLNRLRAIARHASGKGRLFKLLLTHANGTFRVEAIFHDPREILDVPGDGMEIVWASINLCRIRKLVIR
jgi:hypothetical protein